MKTILVCLTSWCKHTWEIDYNVCVFESPNGELTIKRPIKRKKGNVNNPLFYPVKCPICNNKLIKTKEYDRNFRKPKRITVTSSKKN